ARLLAQTAGWSAVGASLLPSTETVISLTQDLQDLLFPGVRRTGSEPGGLLSAETQLTERLQRVASELRGQVVLALRHVRQATLRLHDEPWRVQEEAERQVEEFLRRLPGLHALLMSDVNAAFDKDPAARTRDEIVLCYPGIQAISVYRLAHELQVLGVPYLPRMMTEWA
ncbi:MAG: serine O-acetyltransferase, partial [Planctomycetaceae bacterium]